MAYQRIGVTIYKYINQVPAHNVLKTVYKIGGVDAWGHFTKFSILLLFAEHAGNIRIRRAEYNLFLGVDFNCHTKIYD